MPRGPSTKNVDPVVLARRTMLEGVGAEVAASFPGITRLGGQIVAALYLSEGARSLDELSADLTRSKSNIFTNMRALEGAGIVLRQREPGSRVDTFVLRGRYPDVIIGAYLMRLRRVVADKQELCARTLDILGDAGGAEADALRTKVDRLGAKYDRFALLFNDLLPAFEGPLDLEAIIDRLPGPVLKALGVVARRTVRLLGRDGSKTKR